MKKIEFTSTTDPQHPISSPVNQLPQLHLQLVTKATSAVQKDRFAGTCYKAANRVKVGETKGRGKLGPAGKISVPIKDIRVYPLNKKFKTLLKK